MTLSKTAAEAFERFWAAYPRRPDNPKAAAREVFARRVLAGVDAGKIALAAAAYSRDVAARGLDPKFVPHARTWLSQRRYEDFPTEAPASAELQPSPEPPHPLDHLRAEIGEDAWCSWIARLDVEHLGGAAVITAPNRFVAQEVERRFGRFLPSEREWRITQRTAS